MSLPNEFQRAINVRELLDIFDHDKNAGKHASSVKLLCMQEVQLALFEKYMREQGENVELLGIACTTKGNWLDAWARWPRQLKSVWLQIEVKSWSMHGYNKGTPLHPDAWGEELSQYMQKEWRRTWNDHDKCFLAKGLDKVRRRMRTKHTGEANPEVIPVACLWSAMHPQGNLFEPLFEVATQGEFEKVLVFSVSAYLRQHLRANKGELIILNLPNTAERRTYLDRIFPSIPRRWDNGDLSNAA